LSPSLILTVFSHLGESAKDFFAKTKGLHTFATSHGVLCV
jgi:hypothetical protein